MLIGEKLMLESRKILKHLKGKQKGGPQRVLDDMKKHPWITGKHIEFAGVFIGVLIYNAYVDDEKRKRLQDRLIYMCYFMLAYAVLGCLEKAPSPLKDEEIEAIQDTFAIAFQMLPQAKTAYTEDNDAIQPLASTLIDEEPTPEEVIRHKEFLTRIATKQGGRLTEEDKLGNDVTGVFSDLMKCDSVRDKVPAIGLA